MRITVFSDVHGNFYELDKIFRDRVDDTSIFIFLGDGLGDVEDISCVYPSAKILSVYGNCDFFHPDDVPYFDLLTFGGKKIFFTHGHIFGVKSDDTALISRARDAKADILLYGHTHEPFVRYDGGLYIINPGSLHNNFYGTPSYATVDLLDNGSIAPNIIKL